MKCQGAKTSQLNKQHQLHLRPPFALDVGNSFLTTHFGLYKSISSATFEGPEVKSLHRLELKVRIWSTTKKSWKENKWVFPKIGVGPPNHPF